MLLFAGDVGGTKTELGLFSFELNGSKSVLTKLAGERFESATYENFEAIAVPFLKRNRGTISGACFGVPGPVVNGAVKVTNLPWVLDEQSLQKTLGLPRVKLVNDLAATGYAIPHLQPNELHTLHFGKPQPKGVRAVVAPGTGLGHAIIVPTDSGAVVLPSEAGHVRFAPADDIEIELLEFLKKRDGYVSAESILCGPGIRNIYSFLRDTGAAQEPADFRERFEKSNHASLISEAGLKGENDICVRTLDIFASALGSQAGNIAVTALATGGVYLGGGIPPKLLEKLKSGITVSAFLARGKMSALMETIPLHVILNQDAALLGAAAVAAENAKLASPS